MQVKIRIDRAAAIRAGRDSFGDTIANITPADLTTDERETLLAAPLTPGRDSIPDLSSSDGNLWPGKYPPPPALADADDALAAVKAWLSWRAACKVERARVAAEKEAKEAADLAGAMAEAEVYVSYWRDQPALRFVGTLLQGRTLPRGLDDEPQPPRRTFGGDSSAQEVAREALADKIREAKALTAEREREQEARKAQAKVEAEQAQARRAAQLAAWVRDEGTENQQGRFKLGLLPESEVIDAIRAVAYAPLDGFERYRKIRLDDIDHGDECPGYGELECETAAAEALSAAEFEVYQRIEAAAPAGATLEALAHACTCSACEAGLIRRSVKVAITIGELGFSREYALAAD